MNNSIFISYRRDGGSWSTRTLHDRLIAHFGNDRVFMDITDIDYGSDFASRIEKEIGRCDVLLAIITPGWLSTTDKSGKRRLDNPDDYVRIEIGMGLKRHIPVVPILVDGADMPGEAELPDDLKALSRRNAIELRHSHFDSDIKLLIDSLEKSIANEYPQRRLPAAAHAGNTMTRLYVLIGAVMAALLLAVSAYLMMRGGEQADSSVASAGDGGIAVSGDHVTINQQLNPELMQLVNNAVNRLSQQLETKDDQIRVRDEQTRQLSAAVAALSQTQDQANPPPGLQDAITQLNQGETAAAKAIFRSILEQQAAQAKAAAQAAAGAAQHLGALAVLDDEQEALQAYRRAVELDPENAAARDQLALLQNTPGQLRLQAVLVEGGDPVNACFSIYHAKQDIDGNRERVKYTCDKPARLNLDAGRYYVLAKSGDAATDKEFDVRPGELIDDVLNLDGGQLRLQAALADGGETVASCFSVYHAKQDIDGNRERIRYTCDKPAWLTLNAGRYYVLAQTGDAVAGKEFELKAGQLIDDVLNLDGGQLRLQAVLVDGGDPVNACFSIYHAKQDIDGNRERIRYTCDKPARITLNTGHYYVSAQAGDAVASKEFELKADQLIDDVLNLDGGQLRLQAVLVDGGDPVNACFSIYHAKQDIDGNRERIRYTCDKPAWLTLNAGLYYVSAQAGDAVAGKEFELKAGQLIDDVLNLDGGQLRLQAVLVDGGDPVNACFSIYHAKPDIDGNRERIRYTCDKPASVTLNAGRYYVLAKQGSATASSEFEVTPGQFIDQKLTLQ